MLLFVFDKLVNIGDIGVDLNLNFWFKLEDFFNVIFIIVF